MTKYAVITNKGCAIKEQRITDPAVVEKARATLRQVKEKLRAIDLKLGGRGTVLHCDVVSSFCHDMSRWLWDNGHVDEYPRSVHLEAIAE